MKREKKTVAIELKKIHKTYTLHHEKPTFSEHALGGFKNHKFSALENVNLKIFKGEKIGIIGPNGAGKTTLLKVIVGITTPTSGIVRTSGKVISLIDLESGFHPDLSGKENVYLNGLVIGMTKKEIEDRFEEIVEFADIGNFIDTPLFTYSQGMKLRLGFAIAVFADPDILILDEGIFAGDQDFQRKSIKKIKQFFRANKTILIVSHWLGYLNKNVNRIIWIEDQKVKKDGGLEILELYKKAH